MNGDTMIGRGLNWVYSQVRGERGAQMVEYAFLVMLIALVVAAAALALGGSLGDLFERAKNCITNGTPVC